MRNTRQIFNLRDPERLRQYKHRNFLPIALLMLVVACPPQFAQTNAAAFTQPADAGTKFTDPLHRETPQSAVTAFLEAAHARNYQRALKYLDLRNLSQEDRTKNGAALAKQLAEILDRDGQFDVAMLSRQPEGEAEPGVPANCERVASFQLAGMCADCSGRSTLRFPTRYCLCSAAC
jgi:hypothetical protein